MKEPRDISRRDFVAGATAAVALSAAGNRAGADTAGPASALTALSAVEAVARMTRGELSAERYAQALLERETLSAEDIRMMARGEKLPPLPRGPSSLTPPTPTPVQNPVHEPRRNPPLLGGPEPSPA